MRAPPRPLEEPYRGRAVPPGSARYLSWLFAARECRDPLLGIYALLAEWRALMDPATESTVAQAKLAWWHEELHRLRQGTPVHPISRHLAALPRAAAVDFGPLIRAVEAAVLQIAGAPLERGAQLEAHGDALRGGPLIVAARLAREPAPESLAGLESCATALAAGEYLESAIADYRREARAGRVAFPVDELLAARIEDADLNAANAPPHVQSYLAGARRRAADSFARAAALLPRSERAAQRHLLVLAALGAKRLSGSQFHGSTADFRLGDLYVAWSTARRATARAQVLRSVM